MGKVKKLCLVIILCLVLVLVGCSSTDVNGSLSDIMNTINKDLPAVTKNNLVDTEITDENYAMFLGEADINYEEALVSENMIGSIAHSVILVRLKDGEDIEKAKEEIRGGINPRKWICVWVEDEDVIIENKGNLIIAIIVENKDNRDIIAKGFNSL